MQAFKQQTAAGSGVSGISLRYWTKAGFLGLVGILCGMASARADHPCEPPDVTLIGTPPFILDATCGDAMASVRVEIYMGDHTSIDVDNIVWKLEPESEGYEIVPDPDSGDRAKVIAYHDSAKSETITVIVEVTMTQKNPSCPPGWDDPFVDSQDYQVLAPDSDDDCATCSGDGDGGEPGGGDGSSSENPLGTVTASNNNGPDVRSALGLHDEDFHAGFIGLRGETPSASLAEPSALTVPYSLDNVQVYPASGTIEQVKAPQGLARVVDSSPTDSEYDLEFYYDEDVDWDDPSGRWVPNVGASPFVTWTIENPGGDINKLRISSTTGEQFDYSYDTGSDKWTMTQSGHAREVISWEIVNGSVTERFVQIKSGSEILREVHRTYETLAGRPVLTELEEGDGTTSEVTTYTPYTSGADEGRIKRIDYPAGRWEMLEYDGFGRVTNHYEAYLDMAPPTGGNFPDPYASKLTEHDYTPVDGSDSGEYGPLVARTTTVKVPVETQPDTWAWAEISRTYRAVLSSTEFEEQRCVDPAAGWDDSGNLTTVRVLYDETSEHFGRLKHVVHPDGTATRYEYDSDSNGTTVVEETGEPSTGVTSILNGTQTETERDSLGRLVSRTTREIEAGATSTVLAQETYTYSGDPLLRDYEVVDLAGRTNEFHFGCCGLEMSINPDDVTTTYDHDVLGRQVAREHLRGGSTGVKMTNVLDVVGQVLVARRIGSSGGTIDLNSYEYDHIGRVIRHTNALSGVTTNIHEIVNNRLRETTLYPDGGTRTNYYHRDGRLEKVRGTAVSPVRYLYDAEQDGGSGPWRKFTQEIKLDDQGNDTSEWVKHYSDGVGRRYKTVYPDSAFEETFYNGQGQRWKHQDPDGVTTLYGYDDQGRLDTVAIDVNRNGVIDLGGKDRIREIVRDYTQFAGTDVLEEEVWVYTTDSSTETDLVSVKRSSTDGLKTWETVYRDQTTAVTTSRETEYGTSGGRTNTVTNPDGSRTVTIFSYGWLSSATREDSTGGQVTEQTYTYDQHGRKFTVTDARNGTTVYSHNDADQVETVTTPPPGTGEPGQVTTTFYDNRLRVSGVLHPDGGTVTNEYFKTGLLKKTSGSRTYPVEYTYDPQGRLETMTTWQDFAGDSGTAVTTWNYDSQRGWLSSKDYAHPDTGAPTGTGPDYTYTPGGRLETRTWARGSPRIETTYTYGFNDTPTDNDFSELVEVSYNDGTPGTINTYDRRGRRKTAARNNITTTFTYNDANRLLTESYSGGTLDGFSVEHAYNAWLQRDGLDVKDSLGVLQGVGYSYDSAGRLETVTDNSATSYTATYGYETDSLLVNTITFENGTGEPLVTTRAHDRLERLTVISSTPASASLPVSFAYQYNSANQRTRTTEANGSYWVYQYDELGQVDSGRKYWADGSAVAGQQFDYGFDDIGNRTETGGRESSVSDYNANLLNQYTQRSVPDKVDVMGIANPTAGVTVGVSGGTAYTASRKGEYFHHALTVGNEVYPAVEVKSLYGGTETDSGDVFNPPATESFSHDLDGNLKSDGRWDYTWDGENRLIEMIRDESTPPGARQRITFEYDHQGRRIRKTFEKNGGRGWFVESDTVFLYDGWNLMAELDAENGNEAIRTYIWGLDLSGTEQGAGGVGGLLKVTEHDGPSHHFVAYDGNGNVAALVDGGNGAITARYEYGPFGEPLRATGTMGGENPIRFSSKYTDGESGLVYYGYRYYNSATGRWITRDPVTEIGFRKVNIDFVNNFRETITDISRIGSQSDILPIAFISNDSINAIDFLGLYQRACDCPCKSGMWHGTVTYSGAGAFFGAGDFSGLVHCVGQPRVRARLGGDIFAMGFFIGGASGTVDVCFDAQYRKDLFGKTAGFFHIGADLGFPGVSIGGASGSSFIPNGGDSNCLGAFGDLSGSLHGPGIGIPIGPDLEPPKHLKPGVGGGGAFWGMEVVFADCAS